MNDIEFGIWYHISKYVGFKETQSKLVTISRKFNSHLPQYLLHGHPKVTHGIIIESSGRKLCNLLNIARYSVFDTGLATVSPSGRELLKGPEGINNMQLLRQRSLEDVHALNTAMYTHWEKLGYDDVSIIQ